MPQTPTSLQTETVCRYFTECIKIFTSYATITDKIFLLVYFQREFIFWRSFSVCKTIGIFFFTDRINDRMWNYRRTLCQHMFSVGELVGKKLPMKWQSYTNGLGPSVKLLNVALL
jgi:hypothetical protein